MAGRWRRLRRGELLPGLLFISPWIVGFAWFQLYPIAASIRYSLTDYNMMQPPLWVGLNNYQRLFTNDDLFRKSLTNTAVYSVFSVPLDLAVAFFFALLLNLRIPGRPIFRTVFYFPAVIPSVATAILWSMLLSTRGGLVNILVKAIGYHPIPWLTSPSWTMPSLILLSLWGIGPIVVIFLAGLQDVPRELYEAAKLDGAGPFRLVRDVTIPMLSPVILFNLIVGIIASFQVFTNAFLLTNGGPQNATLFTVLYIYRLGFEQSNMGAAAALSWLLFLIILVFSLIQLRLSRSWVHYEGGET